MKAEWLSDARKIPDEVMNYLRPIAVRAAMIIVSATAWWAMPTLQI